MMSLYLLGSPQPHVQNPFETEKTKHGYIYPPNYKPNTIEKQLEMLEEAYPWLDTTQAAKYAGNRSKYDQSEGLYAFPKPSIVAQRLGIDDFWNDFALLTRHGPFAALSNQRRFRDLRAKVIYEWSRYRLAESARKALVALEAHQIGDILVIEAQTGQLYAGCSARNARFDIEHAVYPSQFPLPSYVVGWILFCNPHRLEVSSDLMIICPGDEYNFHWRGNFSEVLCYRCTGGNISDNEVLYEDWASNDVSSYCGVASGFLP